MPNYKARVKIGGRSEDRWVVAGNQAAAKQIFENIFGKGNVGALSAGIVPPKNAKFVG